MLKSNTLSYSKGRISWDNSSFLQDIKTVTADVLAWQSSQCYESHSSHLILRLVIERLSGLGVVGLVFFPFPITILEEWAEGIASVWGRPAASKKMSKRYCKYQETVAVRTQHNNSGRRAGKLLWCSVSTRSAPGSWPRPGKSPHSPCPPLLGAAVPERCVNTGAPRKTATLQHLSGSWNCRLKKGRGKILSQLELLLPSPSKTTNLKLADFCFTLLKTFSWTHSLVQWRK